MTMSVLGHYNNFFFAAHLLDIAMGFKTLRTILSSVTHNGKQVSTVIFFHWSVQKTFKEDNHKCIFFPACPNSGITGSSGILVHSSGIQFFPKVLQQKWRWWYARYEMRWYANSKSVCFLLCFFVIFCCCFFPNSYIFVLLFCVIPAHTTVSLVINRKTNVKERIKFMNIPWTTRYTLCMLNKYFFKQLI